MYIPLRQAGEIRESKTGGGGWGFDKVSNIRALPNSFSNISPETHNPLCFHIATHRPLLVWLLARPEWRM